MGVSVVNALSTHLKAEVHRDGEIWVQEYKIGKPQAKVRLLVKPNTREPLLVFAQTTVFLKPLTTHGKQLLITCANKPTSTKVSNW